MSVTIITLGLAALIVLSLVAREKRYHLTSASLMVLTGVLAASCAGLFLYFG
jgi:hypothetical protein